jgi:uncharacterized protein (DUF1800 family)
MGYVSAAQSRSGSLLLPERLGDTGNTPPIDLQKFLAVPFIGTWKYSFQPEQMGVAADMELREFNNFRRNAFGRFSNLLEASAKSVAMMIYLNTYENRVLEPNENYAREYLELYALGADNVYTQRDIEKLARDFTGRAPSWFSRASFAAEDLNFQNNPGAPQFPIGVRPQPPPHSFASPMFWDDAVYT